MKHMLGTVVVLALTGTALADGPGYLVAGSGGSSYGTSYVKLNYDQSNPVAITPQLGTASPVYPGFYEVLNAADNSGQFCYATTETEGDPLHQQNWHMWVMDRDGGNRRQITFEHNYPNTGGWNNDTFQNTRGAISPDGRKVAYIENYPVNLQVYWTLESVIWIVTLDGSQPPELIEPKHPNFNPPSAVGTGSYFDLAWSPDSTQLAVVGNGLYDATTNPDCDSHWNGLAIVDAATGAASTVYLWYNQGAYPEVASVAWSHDGSSIAMEDAGNVDILNPAGTVQATIPLGSGLGPESLHFDASDHLWVMKSGIGLYSYDRNGNLLSSAPNTFVNAAWGFAAVDGPAVSRAATIVPSTNLISWPASGGTADVSFKVYGDDGQLLSRIVTGDQVLDGIWGAGSSLNWINAKTDPYGHFWANTVNPGYELVQFSNSTAISSPIAIYLGHPAIRFANGGTAKDASYQYFYISRTNVGDAPDDNYLHPTFTATVNGHPVTLTGGTGNLVPGASATMTALFPAGTFPSGSRVVVVIRETYPGGSATGALRMVAP